IGRPSIGLSDRAADVPAGGGFPYIITGTPTNRLEIEIHTPEAPSSQAPTVPPQSCWTTLSTKAEVRREIVATSTDPCIGADPCSFTVIGRPDSATLAQTTEAHENQHSTDIATAFRQVFEPWDTQLQQAMDERRVFAGTPQEASKAL